MMLVTLQQARDHLRIDTTDDESDLILKIHAASGAVLNYLKSKKSLYNPVYDSEGEVVYDSQGDYEPELDSEGEPVLRFEIMAATLLMLGYLYKDRDENADGAYELGYLPRPVMSLLYQLRDPALA